MSHRRRSLATPCHDRSILAFACVILFALLIVPTTASAYDKKIPLRRYRGGFRSYEGPQIDSHIFKEVAAQGDNLYASANDTLIANPKKVAIIGGGFGGVSIAHRFDSDQWPDLHATVFERESYLGGRARTVMSYDNYLNEGEVVTTGGGIFDRDDHIVRDRGRQVGVDLKETSKRDDQASAHISVWNGEELRVDGSNIEHSFNQKLTSMIRNQGFSPKFWKLLVQETWNYDPNDYMEKTNHLKWERIKRSVSRKLDCSHVGPDQDELARLSTELGIQIPRPGLTVRGGNERFLKRMLRMSGSTLRLNSTVTRIKRYADLTFDVHWQSKNLNGSVNEHTDRFDAVVIAAPFHQSGIEIEPALQVSPEEVSYKPVHVTNVASREVLDPESFNLKADEEVPHLIWASTEIPRNSSKPTPLPPFLSIQRRLLDRSEGCIGLSENLYQIVSEQPISDNDIANLFKKNGVARETVTFPEQRCYHWTRTLGPSSQSPEWREQSLEAYESWFEEVSSSMDCEEGCTPVKSYAQWCADGKRCRGGPDVRWIHRQSWNHGLPIVDSNRSEAPIELAPRIFYVNGFEGRDGASLSGSLRKASTVLTALSWDYCNLRMGIQH